MAGYTITGWSLRETNVSATNSPLTTPGPDVVVVSAGAVTLDPLTITLSGPSIPAEAAPGTVVATVSGWDATTPAGGRALLGTTLLSLNAAGTAVVVGASGLTGAAGTSITGWSLQETNANATNSPLATAGPAVVVDAAAITLAPLTITLAGASIPAEAAPGTTVATVSGWAASTVAGGRALLGTTLLTLNATGDAVVVGVDGLSAAAGTTISGWSLQETNAAASNSPLTTAGPDVPVNAAAGIVTQVSVAPEGNRLLVNLNTTPTTANFTSQSDDGETAYYHPDFAQLTPKFLKVSVVVQSQGFTRSGGTVVPTTWPRTIRATAVARQTSDSNDYSAANALWRPIQRDIGGGIHQIELWLEDLIYATDTITSISFDNLWRTGGSAQSFASPANGSTKANPVPKLRNINRHYELVRGASATMSVDYLVASKHPMAFGPVPHNAVAGIRIRAFDSAGAFNEKWIFNEGLSTQYGDSVPCWNIDTLSAGLFTGLTQGQIVVHATAYPWIGGSWSTGDSNAAPNARTVAPNNGLIVLSDNASTLYPNPHYIVCDPVGGTTTVASVTTGLTDDLAAAKARATKPKDVTVALAAIRALSATGSQNLKIVLPAGTTDYGATTYTAFTSGAGLEIIGDPADANPNLNCIMNIQASGALNAASQAWTFKNLYLMASNTLSSNGNILTFINCTMDAVTAGRNFTASAPVNPGEASANIISCIMKNGWWTAHTNSRLANLARSNSGDTIGGATLVNNNMISTSVGTGPCLFAWGNVDHRFVAFNSAQRMGVNGDAVGIPAGGTANSCKWSNFVYMGNLFERRGNDTNDWGNRFIQWETVSVQDSIIEGNTLMGAGWNWHNWSQGVANYPGYFHVGNRVVGNIRQRMAHKGDFEAKLSDYVSEDAARAGQELQYGVGHFGNVDLNIVPSFAINNQSRSGQYSVQVFPLSQTGVSRPEVAFVSENCFLSATPYNGVDVLGDYRVGPTATVLNSVNAASNSGYYRTGQVKPAVFTPGAMGTS